ncbi:hypothetical protein BEN49_03060 [Hymenobacter coccineus]|uniref:Uncharacterized protein n=1 Tax=Hymenobacter coccineus TaxID=1908235 RepID=A0A1G1SSA3_9BACT|nr:hypothetical protein BEN49_03060 [Hymenobacter coccineus]
MSGPRGGGRARQARAVEGQGGVAVVAADGVVHGHELGAVGEGALDLHFGHEVGHAGQHVGQAQQLLALVHEHSHSLAVADEFEQLGGDEGHGFRVVEAQAAGVALLGHEARLVQHQLVEVFGGEVHGRELINCWALNGWRWGP